MCGRGLLRRTEQQESLFEPCAERVPRTGCCAELEPRRAREKAALVVHNASARGWARPGRTRTQALGTRGSSFPVWTLEDSGGSPNAVCPPVSGSRKWRLACVIGTLLRSAPRPPVTARFDDGADLVSMLDAAGCGWQSRVSQGPRAAHALRETDQAARMPAGPSWPGASRTNPGGCGLSYRGLYLIMEGWMNRGVLL